MTRVVLVAQSPMARAGMKAMLRDVSPEVEIRGSTSLLPEAVTQVSNGVADVIIAEIDQWDEKTWPSWGELAPPVVALADLTAGELLEALRLGLRAILPREATADQIASAAMAAHQGLVVLTTADLDPLVSASLRTASDPAHGEGITAREKEVLRLVADGLGNKQVAATLNISEHTVKFHITSIMTKLDAGTRTEAVAVAIRRGLIPV